MTRLNSFNKALTALCLASAGTLAFAHGDTVPKHGGVVQVANEISFELVAGLDSSVMLYLEDHSQALDTVGFSGKLSVLNKDGVKTSAPLTPAGANALVAKGLTLGTGAKAVAVITTPQNLTLALRFTLP